MLDEQEEPKIDNKINILMMSLSLYFSSAKKTPEGYINRSTWLKTNEQITSLITFLIQKKTTTESSED